MFRKSHPENVKKTRINGSRIFKKQNVKRATVLSQRLQKTEVMNRKDSSGVQLCTDSSRFKCNSIDDSDGKKVFSYYYSVNQAMKVTFTTR